MAKDILFLNVEYIRENSMINGNVDNKIIEPFIKKCQDKYIEPILGTDLLQKLKNDISGNTVTGNYKILLDEYVQKCLVEWVIYEGLPFFNYKITNKAVSKKDSDNSSPSDLDEIKYLRNNVRDTSEYYSQRITDYLCANQSDFPEYTSNNDSDDIRPNKTSYFGGIYLDGLDDNCDFGLGIGIPLN
jgi:hypothetical protein